MNFFEILMQFKSQDDDINSRKCRIFYFFAKMFGYFARIGGEEEAFSGSVFSTTTTTGFTFNIHCAVSTMQILGYLDIQRADPHKWIFVVCDYCATTL